MAQQLSKVQQAVIRYAIEVIDAVPDQALPILIDVSIESSEDHGVLIRFSSPDILVKAFEQFDQFVRQIVEGRELGVVALGAVGHAAWDCLR